MLAGLFHTAYLYASVIRGYTHAVIEVNPRHVAFYGRALKFEPIGEERMNKRVNAPAVLLCAPFATIADGFARFAGKPEAPGAGRSLFVYGFPPEEEAGRAEPASGTDRGELSQLVPKTPRCLRPATAGSGATRAAIAAEAALPAGNALDFPAAVQRFLV